MKKISIPISKGGWHSEFECEPYGPDGFSFEYTNQYDPPELSYSVLRFLSVYFGTEKIDTSETITQHGCETCNFGSKYGFRIIVEGATRNNPFKEGQQ